jgi:hypothetical protein
MKLRMESSRSVGKYPEYISEVSELSFEISGWFEDSDKAYYFLKMECLGLGKVILLHTKLRNQRNMEIDCKIWV